MSKITNDGLTGLAYDVYSCTDMATVSIKGLTVRDAAAAAAAMIGVFIGRRRNPVCRKLRVNCWRSSYTIRGKADTSYSRYS